MVIIDILYSMLFMVLGLVMFLRGNFKNQSLIATGGKLLITTIVFLSDFSSFIGFNGAGDNLFFMILVVYFLEIAEMFFDLYNEKNTESDYVTKKEFEKWKVEYRKERLELFKK